MEELSIRRNLTDATRKQAVWMRNGHGGVDVYSLHIARGKEVIITDSKDYSKIYAVYSLDFFNSCSPDDG